MAQEYKLTSLDDGGNDPFKDQNGNTWCTAAFEGVSEPVKWVLKDPSKITVGQSYRGDIKVPDGKKYQRFYREQQQQQNQGYTQSTNNYKSYDNPDKQNQIRAQWAIGQAVQLNAIEPSFNMEAIEINAKKLYAMVDRVVGETTPKAPAPQNSGAEPTGRNSQVWQDLRDKKHSEVVSPHEESDAEYQSLIASAAAGYADTDKVNLDDIPF